MVTQLPPLPAEDRRRSPVTGWTRAHWETVADRLLAAVVPYASPDFAQFRLPGRASRSGTTSDGLEGFARTFLLAGFRIAGARGVGCDALVARYAAGLAAGTDPGHPYAWPPLVDHSQQLVEAASVALALHETREWIFDRLDRPVRERVLHWLAGFIGTRTYDSNWRLFQVITEQFLATAGGPYAPGEIFAGLDRIEDFYVADGWYTDGIGQNFDHYAGWAMQLYPLLWTRMSGDADRAARYRSRLSDFLGQYQHFFAADGAPLHQGRSLCYRFATTAPLWLGALVDATPLTPGQTRRLASGALRHFVARGAPDSRGLLPLGWYGEFLPAVQSYSGPASPYWASKAFLGLLLPAEHPVWTATEQPGPADGDDHVLALPAPGWLLHATGADGVVRVLNHGSDRAGKTPTDEPEDPHYARLAYSTHTAPETAPDAAAERVDGHAAVLAPDGTASRRRHIERIGVHDRFAASAYDDVLPDGAAVRVVTASVVHGAAEVRVHRVTAPAGYRLRDGGYALADAVAPRRRVGPGWASVSRPDGLCSTVVALADWVTTQADWVTPRAPLPVDRAPGAVARARHANAYGPCSATPYVLGPAHPGGSAVQVSLVVLGGGPTRPLRWRAGLGVLVTADGAVLTFPDGEQVTVGLGDQPWYERRPADGGAALRWSPDGLTGPAAINRIPQ